MTMKSTTPPICPAAARRRPAPRRNEAPHQRGDRIRQGASGLCLAGAALLTPALALAAAPANAPAAGQASRDREPGARPHVQAVRVLATRSHAQCPLPGKKIAVLSIDSPQEWTETLQQDEASTAGRAIRWSREQVLVYAMNQQPTLGVSVEPAARVLSLHSGVLMWPVREVRPGPGQMAATALSRPCLVAIVKRAYWQRIRIVRK
ncbi:hypothetical protein CATMQ487_37980 [Sphaerotilus microaerophilus]|uniref:Uncharacterized protein n=2 Tax=Sphaerotilus microaerophilus TaxID=2914710 RepID=A0ABM7YQK7_9BURK|nr:hypothetical protein CATMQ487_37980 [Sphaerotilus sp. FB-5]